MASDDKSIGLLISLLVICPLSASLELVDTTESTSTKGDTILQDLTVKNINNSKQDGPFWEAKELSQNIIFSQSNEGKRNSDLEMPRQLPTSIEVNTDSILYIESGQPATINFRITNNRYSYLYYTFDANADDLIIRQIQPRRSYISPASSITVLVRVSSDDSYSKNEYGTKIVTFSARWSTVLPYNEEIVSKRVYVHLGKQPTDSTKPSIYYTYNGDCSGSFNPIDCQSKVWRVDFTIQDSNSGLLMIRSVPVGMILNKEFIVGTKEEITGYYRASCCQTKLDIVARDLNGNERITAIDIENLGLSTGEIISIVLGSILLLILIISIIICILCIRRKRSRTLNIYPDSLRS